MNYDSTKAMAEFTEILKNEPQKAYDFISCNYYRFDKDDLVNIIKEILYSLHYHTFREWDDVLYSRILEDVQIELDEQYDEAYQEYQKEMGEA